MPTDFLKSHVAISAAILMSSVAYAANPVSINCYECSSGYDFECFSNHDSGANHWKWTDTQSPHGTFNASHPAGDLTLYVCPAGQGSNFGVVIKATAHDYNHDLNGSNTKSVLCNPI